MMDQGREVQSDSEVGTKPKAAAASGTSSGAVPRLSLGKGSVLPKKKVVKANVLPTSLTGIDLGRVVHEKDALIAKWESWGSNSNNIGERPFKAASNYMDEMIKKVVEPLIRANKDMAMELSHHRRVALGVENISESVQSLDEALREMREGRGEVVSERLINEPSNMEMATALVRLESALCEKLDRVLARIDKVERTADKAVSQVESLKREEMVAIGRKVDVLSKRTKEGEIKKSQPVATPREGGSGTSAIVARGLAPLPQRVTNLRGQRVTIVSPTESMESSPIDTDEEDFIKVERKKRRREPEISPEAKRKGDISQSRLRPLTEDSTDTDRVSRNSEGRKKRMKKKKSAAAQVKAAKGFAVRAPKGMSRPLLVKIYRVDKEIGKDELGKSIWNQNPELHKLVTEGEWNEQFHPSFVKGRREFDDVIWVARVTEKVREALLKIRMLNIRFDRCRVEDYLDVSRCYKCQVWGHTTKVCTEQKETCGHCAQEHGGKVEDCPRKSTAPPKCANCARAGLNSNHAVDTFKCPAYQKAVTRYMRVVNPNI
ncbi:hypothetical protein GE061_013663 [Apolygus lucorum]|uniref:CCHC-type domain-containing protein n=1 Tax=Apolygus lucorum TaxID=248454 RepID=A0A8S9XNK7_APOLU|nr:hypothetical protein GE061_013663 [Apolygus lucorum]